MLPLPPELGGLEALERLSLYSNQLEGQLPPELGRLANLVELSVHDNELQGAIPTELGNLANLRRLRLSGNRFTGSIPPTLGALVNLQRLLLDRNGLAGPLPPELGSLAALQRLYVGHNELTGSVPQEFGGLTNAQELAFSGNADMSGALPLSLTRLRSLETIETSGTRLCAPSDPRVADWLDDIPNPRVARCESASASAYLVQAVQSREFPVPLVSGKEALLRAFVTAEGANQERIPPVRASLYLNGGLAHVADIPAKPGPIPMDVQEGLLAASANGVVPAEVVRPSLEMVIEIDPDSTLDPGLTVTKRIPETGRLAVDVREMPLFDLTIIPFLWSTDPDSTILDHTAGMAADPEGHELLEWTRILLPVGDLDVKAHEPVVTSSNVSYAILRETGVIHAMEGGSGHHMGMLSGPGRGGVAVLGGRVSFASPSARTIAHEFGHNMSLSHAPCGGASNPDPAYPYPEGATGAWGFDSRDGGRLVPPGMSDLMSYCTPRDGISDYHFSKALRYRLADEESAGTGTTAALDRSLLLWGGVDSTGVPHLEPVFVVDASPALPDSAGAHRITGRGASGGELFSFSFTMPEVADGDGSSSFAFVVPVRAEWEGSLAAITLSGPGGSATLDGESDIPMAILRNPGTGQVRGFLRELPAPTQAAMAAAGVVVQPGLEVLFSRGIPDAEAWDR